MDAQGIVENKIVHHPLIECVRLLEQPDVVVDEFFLNGTVESFHVSVHLRGFWIGAEMSQMKPPQLLGKVFLEFRAVVGKHKKEIV